MAHLLITTLRFLFRGPIFFAEQFSCFNFDADWVGFASMGATSIDVKSKVLLVFRMAQLSILMSLALALLKSF
jgi:hypothetical protein